MTTIISVKVKSIFKKQGMILLFYKFSAMLASNLVYMYEPFHTISMRLDLILIMNPRCWHGPKFIKRYILADFSPQ